MSALMIGACVLIVLLSLGFLVAGYFEGRRQKELKASARQRAERAQELTRAQRDRDREAAPVPYVLTQSERSKAAKAAVHLERRRREQNQHESTQDAVETLIRQART